MFSLLSCAKQAASQRAPKIFVYDVVCCVRRLFEIRLKSHDGIAEEYALNSITTSQCILSCLQVKIASLSNIPSKFATLNFR